MKQPLITRIAAALTLAVSLIDFGSPISAGNRGGAQAVVFPNWNATSVSNLVAVVDETAPAEFELSQCPFFGGDNRWANTVSFLTKVNGTTRIVGTFHLSFHTDQAGYDLARRTTDLVAFLTTTRAELGNQTPISRFASVVLSPQLEDSYSDSEWKAKVRVILDKLDEPTFLRSGKLALRRSVQSQGSSLNGSDYTYRRGANTYELRVSVEKHAFGSIPAAGSWSNDGDFVYLPDNIDGNYEDVTSWSGNNGKRLSEFIAAAKNRSGATTLWRPSMNLAIRTVNNHKVSWIKNSSPAWLRTDTDTTFDAREKVVLKAFLNGLK